MHQSGFSYKLSINKVQKLVTSANSTWGHLGAQKQSIVAKKLNYKPKANTRQIAKLFKSWNVVEDLGENEWNESKYKR